MALLSRIYFNAVFGALGGLLGWLLYGAFCAKRPTGEDTFLGIALTEDSQMFVGGAIIGGMIGYFVVSVEAIRDVSLARFARLGTYGFVLAAVGGAPGMWLGDYINSGVQKAFGDNLFSLMLGRGLGWTSLGIMIGMSEGIAARSLGKFSYGILGGALGGFIGGSLFGLIYQGGGSSYVSGALGLIILGACIGSLSALVKAVFQPASVKVMRGWQEGREYPLDKAATLLGRDEQADIALFRDMKVEKRHAFVKRVGERYLLVNNNAPPEQTRVNDVPVGQSQELNDGDRIQLGNVQLRFQARAAVNRARAKRPLPTPGAASSSAIRKMQ